MSSSGFPSTVSLLFRPQPVKAHVGSKQERKSHQ
jgi:hypothetical protein